jgi:hypothetical protein
MTGEPWTEPTWTVDQLRKLGKKISSLVRMNKVTSPISTVLVSALMLEVAFFIYLLLMPVMWPGSGSSQILSWLPGVLILTFMISMAVSIVAGSINDRLSYLLERYNKIGVVVKIRCEKCGRTDERTWSKDDYVFKEEGTCACGGPRFISQVYLMPLPLKKALAEQ